jgi:hypothetical protein
MFYVHGIAYIIPLAMMMFQQLNSPKMLVTSSIAFSLSQLFIAGRTVMVKTNYKLTLPIILISLLLVCYVLAHNNIDADSAWLDIIIGLNVVVTAMLTTVIQDAIYSTAALSTKAVTSITLGLCSGFIVVSLLTNILIITVTPNNKE